jgi:hypothetical protein
VNTTLRFVTSSLAVAIISTLVKTENTQHYAHLAERVTASSPLGQLVTMIQAGLMAKGYSATAGYAYALKTVSGLLQRQSYMLAIQDAFRVSFFLAIVAIIATLFVSGSKKKQETSAQERPLTPQEAEEADRAREEAAMAV